MVELFIILEYNEADKISIGEGNKSEKTYFRYSSYGNRCYQHNFYHSCDSIISVKSVFLQWYWRMVWLPFRNEFSADDNYFLHSFQDVQNYSDKKNGVCLEWNYFTEGRAKQIIEYIKNALQNTTSIELWHVWLMDYYEFEDRPVIHKQTVSIDELTTKHIKEIDDAEIWNTPDKMYPNRPSFYCLEIKR